MLSKILQDYGLSKTEAQSYLAVLELGTAPVSSIARRTWENRVTVYSSLKNLVKKWIALETPKKWSTYYSVISPEKLIHHMKDKYAALEKALPQFLAIANKYDNKPKVEFYEWLEWLKNIYENIILHGGDDMEKDEPYLTFTWTGDIDPKFQQYLMHEFAPRRLKFSRKTKTILSKQTGNIYGKYHTTKHESLVIDDPVFDFANEMMIYGKDKVALVMYTSQEMCGLVITSSTLHKWLKSMFNLIRKLSKKGKK